MNSHKNNRHRHHKFLWIILDTALVLLLFVLLKWELIPAEARNYYQEHETYQVAYVIVENQRNLHHELLVQYTYRTPDGQRQTIYTYSVNTVTFTGASLNLPGFGQPGGVSGSKLVSVSLQHLNNPDDPSTMENSVSQLNGGTDIFFNIVHVIPVINDLLNAHLYTLTLGPVSGYTVQCYAIYAQTEPDFTLIPEQVTKNCNAPQQFTHPPH